VKQISQPGWNRMDIARPDAPPFEVTETERSLIPDRSVSAMPGICESIVDSRSAKYQSMIQVFPYLQKTGGNEVLSGLRLLRKCRVCRQADQGDKQTPSDVSHKINVV